MQDINLIPQKNKVTKEVVQKTNSVSSFLKILIVLLFISILTVAAVYAIVYFRLRQTKEEHAKLRQELSTLQKSEQKYILLRDRLEKISTVKKAFNTKEEIAAARDLLANISSPSRISDLRVSPEMVEVEITTDSSLNMTKIFSYLVGSGQYIRVNMLSFSYNPKTAYKLNLQIFKQ